MTSWVIGNNLTATDRSTGGNLGGTNGSDIGATKELLLEFEHRYKEEESYLAGQSGLKTVELFPRQPEREATPESPEAKKTETPRRPSFMNLPKSA